MSESSKSVSVPVPEPEWAAFAAIDWADQKNFWRLLPAGSQRSEEGVLENTPEAVEAWAVNLQQRFDGPACGRMFGTVSRSVGLYAQ
jgi:hypothetical protein